MKSTPLKLRLRYCLDTGPLLDHFILSFFEERNAPPPDGLAAKVKFMGTNPQLRARFKELLQGSKVLVTCPGVLLEVDQHFRSVKAASNYVGPFRDFLQKQVKRWNVEERFIPWGNLEAEELRSFGPVDASLMALLRSQPEEPLRLITGDEPLRHACLQRRLSCMDVHELLGDKGA